MGASQKRRIIVGDIHGELHIFREIIRNAGLIDDKDRWAGSSDILIQTGDVIDRGQHSIESFNLLKRLQTEAKTFSGEVIRLCGNHELMILQGYYYYTNIYEPEDFAYELKSEIQKRNVLASYTDGERLYTHAGLVPSIGEHLLNDIKSKGQNNFTGEIDIFLLSDYINRIFRESVETNELRRHPIYHVDRLRGGPDPVGGIFWCDFASISACSETLRISQVFGHTPTGRNALKTAHGLKLIDVDAGMCRVYGGRTVYLEITPEGILIQHSKTSGSWTETVLRNGQAN